MTVSVVALVEVDDSLVEGLVLVDTVEAPVVEVEAGGVVVLSDVVVVAIVVVEVDESVEDELTIVVVDVPVVEVKAEGVIVVVVVVVVEVDVDVDGAAVVVINVCVVGEVVVLTIKKVHMLQN